MAAAAKKTAAQKAAPAVRARRDARQSGKSKPYEVKFRGETFEVSPDRLGSAPVWYANRRVQQQDSSDYAAATQNVSDLVFKILGDADRDRWLRLLRYDDNPLAVAGEFLAALNKASNVPNS